MTPDPAIIGRRVLVALEAGRQRAIAEARARSATLARQVRRLMDDDALAGHSPRGRAGRIARRLRRAGVTVTERHVRRILSDTLSSESGSPTQDAVIDNHKDRAA